MLSFKPVLVTGFFVRNYLDLLFQCAKNYEHLLNFKYHFVIARKGVMHEFFLTFQKSDFHHLAGLHKLTDKMSLQHGSREKLFDKILNEEFSIQFLKSSFHYMEMQERLESLVNLELLLDSENLIFKYNENVRLSSKIKSEYLLESCIDSKTLFLFLGARDSKKENEQSCRSFFPKSKIDYSIGQPKYTLLKKEKINVLDDTIVTSYIRNA